MSAIRLYGHFLWIRATYFTPVMKRLAVELSLLVLASWTEETF